MDSELRALVRKLSLDPEDRASGSQLARLVERLEPSRESAPRVPAELVGSAALVVRRSKPRVAFAWRPFMDAAIGRVGLVRALSQDGLTAELFVPGVGRFHAGAGSLFPIPDVSAERSGESEERDTPRESEFEPRSIADLRRLAAIEHEDVQGELGADGFTETQRWLMDSVLAPSGIDATLGEHAARAGFVRENNRGVRDACAVLYELSAQNPRVRYPLVRLDAPALLPGAVAPGSLDTGAWSLADLAVASVPRGLRKGDLLPWALLQGARVGGAGVSPPHEATEVADALVKLLESPRADLDDVLAFLPGPDFTGGGEVSDEAAIRSLYETGRGTLRLRASIELVLPSRIVISTPFFEEAHEAFRVTVDAAVRAGLDGIAAFRENLWERPFFEVEIERGVDLLAVKKSLERLLFLEQDARFELPMPLVPWLRFFLEEKLRVIQEFGLVKRSLVALRANLNDSERRTRIV
ncbi:hypothetical protein HY251_14720 [bacterium]|nr:hypothetical protein [bacterium]